jgi:bifunctional non-homologous end joining protein LigD
VRVLEADERLEGQRAGKVWSHCRASSLAFEGIVSKRLGSYYKSGRTDKWRKTKCWTESALILIGTEIDRRTGSPIALLARDE